MELRLAVVDDDISIRKMLRRIIEETGLGTVVAECSDGMLAEQIIQESRPDIALIDLLLPGQDGVELIKHLASETPATSFIMISQVNSEPLVTRAYESGIEFFIHKPINVLEVRSVINRVKESRNLRRFVNYVHQTASQFSEQTAPLQTNGVASLKSVIYRIFSDLGMIGEAGIQDIYLLGELIYTNRQQGNNVPYQLNELYSQLSVKLNQDAKTIEQRIRRAIANGLQNVANMGIDDYYNDKFQNYSTSLFDFKEVRQEISFANGKSKYHGKINVKKFVEGILFLVEHG